MENKQKLFRNITELKEWDRNPRSIKEADFQKLKNQIVLLGQYKPLLTMKDGTVLGGNMRIRAYRELEFTDVWVSEIDFIEKGGLWYALVNGAEQKKPFTRILQGMTEYALSDNDRAGFYNQDELANLMSEADVDLDAYHVEIYEPQTVADLLEEEETKEDEPPPVSTEESKSKRGEVYQIGRHRLICGDATKIEDIQKLLNGVSPDLVFTDPPYNVDYVGKTEDALKIENDKFKTQEEYYQFLLSAFSNIGAVIKAGAVVYICHADTQRINTTKAFIDAGFKLAQVIIWAKQHFVMGRQDYQWQHEPILYGWKEGESHYFVGDRTQTTIWNIDRPTASLEHPTMKPIALISKALQNNSKSGDIVLDVFGGSGSTLIACEQTNRICYMVEIDPKYCDVIRKRYAKFLEKPDEWELLTPVIQ